MPVSSASGIAPRCQVTGERLSPYCVSILSGLGIASSAVAISALVGMSLSMSRALLSLERSIV